MSDSLSLKQRKHTASKHIAKRVVQQHNTSQPFRSHQWGIPSGKQLTTEFMPMKSVIDP